MKRNIPLIIDENRVILLPVSTRKTRYACYNPENEAKKTCVSLPEPRKYCRIFDPGEMAERSNAAVLKTVEGNTSGGSNPSLSAKYSSQLFESV